MSFTAAKNLGLISLHIDCINNQNKDGGSDNATENDDQLNDTLNGYAHVFRGLGKLKDSKICLNIDESITPVALTQRRLPFHIRDRVDKALDQLLEDDVIEQVPENQPTPWVSPIVAIPQKDETIRLCLDMRKPNEAIKRTRFPIPTSKDIDILLNGACYFSKLDVRHAFHQLELDESSRYVTTFTTHKGLFRYKRLNFGTNAASAIFQNALEKHLCEMEGVRNMQDDIIVFGKSRQEHGMALKQCLEKLATIGITLRKSKSKFLQTELTFFGHTYSKNFIKPDKERINDILNLETPSSIREVRSFLGMLNYCSKFIGDFPTTTSSLRDMIKGNKFEWNQTHEKVFNKLKQKLASSPVMAYFDMDKETYLHVDASPFGLSGILMQKQEQSGDFRILAYGSRSLSNVETRYSQTEREALAIV